MYSNNRVNIFFFQGSSLLAESTGSDAHAGARRRGA